MHIWDLNDGRDGGKLVSNAVFSYNYFTFKITVQLETAIRLCHRLNHAVDWCLLFRIGWCYTGMLFDWIVFLNKILCQRYHQRFATFEFRGNRIGWRLWACNQAFYQYCSRIFGRERVKSMNSDGIAHHYCSFNFYFFRDSRFVREFNGNFQYFIIVTYVWTRLTMLSSMITLHFVLVDHNTIPVELIRAIILVGLVFLAMFFICNLGQTITNEFEIFNAELNKCNWYAFPLKMQQMTLIFSSNAQQLAAIRGYGFKWNQNTFKRVNLLECLCEFGMIEIRCVFCLYSRRFEVATAISYWFGGSE